MEPGGRWAPLASCPEAEIKLMGRVLIFLKAAPEDRLRTGLQTAVIQIRGKDLMYCSH